MKAGPSLRAPAATDRKGVGNPIFLRYRISCGSMSSTAFLKMYLPVAPRSFMLSGTRAENSTNCDQAAARGFRSKSPCSSILLHQQFDQVGFLVGIEHPGQRRRIGTRFQYSRNAVIRRAGYVSAIIRLLLRRRRAE